MTKMKEDLPKRNCFDELVKISSPIECSWVTKSFGVAVGAVFEVRTDSIWRQGYCFEFNKRT